ncbi:MAG: iron chelate uptake ABC transporter family permease subunit [Candidatus Lokiarchaeota archaeon]|nr:iron chelate uptake ABC transporter family permease subunit [Candidatus Lokiarchaeota archaeon]
MKANEIQEDFEKYNKRREYFIILNFFLILVFIIVGITFGAYEISIFEIVEVLFGGGERTQGLIIWRIRMPRVLSALLAGMALGLAGVTMQSILRNPIGSPFTLGISQAAVFGVAFAVIVLGAGSLRSQASDAVLINNLYSVTIFAFLFSLFSTSIVLLLIKLKNAKPETMILTGIILGSLFSALTTALMYFANDVQIASVIFWTFGDLNRATWNNFFILSIILVPALIYFMKNAWNYNVLNSGDETAESLGVNCDRLRIYGMIVASLTVSVVIAFFGIIAFVGLVVPHIVRRIIGGDERYLIPASCLFGGVFLLIADTIARTIISPIVLPVGILTSFLGAPLFLYLLLKKEDRGFW